MSINTPVKVQLEHPVTFDPLVNDKDQPMMISVWGPDSEPMRQVEKMISNDMLERASRARGGRFKMDATATDRYNRQRFLARLDGWDNLVMGGKPFAYNEVNKKAIYDEPKYGFIRRQIDLAASADDTAFLVKTVGET